MAHRGHRSSGGQARTLSIARAPRDRHIQDLLSSLFQKGKVVMLLPDTRPRSWTKWSSCSKRRRTARARLKTWHVVQHGIAANADGADLKKV